MRATTHGETSGTWKRRVSTRAALALALLLAVGMVAAIAPAARAAGSCGELGYANGDLYCLNITSVITNPSQDLLAKAQPLYISSYFPLPAGCDVTNPATCGAESLPSGYQPLCNPCFHGGGLNAFPYHDHVLKLARGSGHEGDDDVTTGAWVLIIVAYQPGYSNQAGFVPFRSAHGIRSGERAGDFQTINPGASNAFEINTGVVVIVAISPLD